jgi:hypothetical protein
MRRLGIKLLTLECSLFSAMTESGTRNLRRGKRGKQEDALAILLCRFIFLLVERVDGSGETAWLR